MIVWICLLVVDIPISRLFLVWTVQHFVDAMENDSHAQLEKILQDILFFHFEMNSCEFMEMKHQGNKAAGCK